MLGERGGLRSLMPIFEGHPGPQTLNLGGFESNLPQDWGLGGPKRALATLTVA